MTAKNLGDEESLGRYGPGGGCSIWGLFHPFHHNRRRRLPLPRKSHDPSSPSRKEKAAIKDTDPKMGALLHSQQEDSNVEEKLHDRVNARRTSMKSRIRSLITNEMSRMKGRHRRSSSCPNPNKESGLCMDALQFVNDEEEVMKTFQDSCLARELPTSRSSLRKSVSFPLTKADAAWRRQEMKWGFNVENSCTDDVKRHENKRGGFKRFKKLRQTIRNVMRVRKEEKKRIIMDAVYHKVPVTKMPQQVKRTGPKSFRRTRSFNEFSGERNEKPCHVTDLRGCENLRRAIRPTISAASLMRTHSLPELRGSSWNHLDDDDFVSCYEPDEASGGADVNMGNSCLARDGRSHRSSVSSWSHLNMVDAGDAFEDSVDSKSWETASSHQMILDPGMNSASHLTLENQQEVADSQGSSNHELGKHPLENRDAVSNKNTAEFNHIREALIASGLTTAEMLSHHSTLFERLQLSTNDHQLLFDLINRLPTKIQDFNWPTLLCSRSVMHHCDKAHHIINQVLGDISYALNLSPDTDEAVDVVSRDFSRDRDWMDLQMDAESVAFLVEDLIFEDLIQEIHCFLS